MFNAAKEMSPLERAFVKAYALALIRDADLMRCVVGLMEPDGLGLNDVAAAVVAATKLLKLEQEFSVKLAGVATQLQLPEKKLRKADQAQEQLLLDIFGLSFFKLSIKDESSFLKKKYDAGWFSGKPAEWSNFLTDSYGGNIAKHATEKKESSSVFDIFSKLFDAFLPKNLSSNKLWPPQQSHMFLFYSDDYYDEDDDEDEEDDYDY